MPDANASVGVQAKWSDLGVSKGLKDLKKGLDDTTKGLKSADSATGQFMNIGRSVSNLAKTYGVLAAGAVAVGVAAYGLVKDYAASEAAENRLKVSVLASNNAWGDNVGALNKTISTGEQLAFSHIDQENALSRLVQGTQNVTQSQRLLQTAENVSRGTGKDLTTTAIMLGKVYNGNVGALKRFGIAIDSSATSQQALAELQSRFAGQADAYANSTAGRLDELSISWDDLKEHAGGAIVSMGANDGMKTIVRDLDWLTQGLGRQKTTWADVGHEWTDFLGITQNAAGGVQQLTDSTTGLSTANLGLIDSSSDAEAGVSSVTTAMDDQARAADALDTDTVSYIHDLNGLIVPSNTVAAAQRDLRDKTDALAQAKLAQKKAQEEATTAEDKYGKKSPEYRAALAARDQANLKVKDSTGDVQAATDLLKQREQDAKNPMEKYRLSLGGVDKAAQDAANSLANIHLPTDNPGYSSGTRNHASGTITTGPERSWIGEAGREVVIPTENPRYRKNAVALWNFAGSELGLLPKGKGDVGEGDTSNLATQVATLKDATKAGMQPLKTARTTIDRYASKFGRLAKMEDFANSQVGLPYVWGSRDCSWYVSSILSAGGINPDGRFTTSQEPGLFTPGRGQYVTIGLVPGHHTGIELPNGWYEAPHTGANLRGPGQAKSSWPEYYHVQGYKRGTNYVPSDGLAYLHQGEKVIPANGRSETPSVIYAPNVTVIADAMTDIEALRAELYDVLDSHARSAQSMIWGGESV